MQTRPDPFPLKLSHLQPSYCPVQEELKEQMDHSRSRCGRWSRFRRTNAVLKDRADRQVCATVGSAGRRCGAPPHIKRAPGSALPLDMVPDNLMLLAVALTMIACEYCGRENDDTATYCVGCGSVLARPTLSLNPPLLSPPILDGLPPTPVLNASRATLVLLTYFFAQVIAMLLVLVPASVIAAARGFRGRGVTEELIDALLPWMVLLMMILSAGGIVIAGVGLAPAQLKDGSPTGAAWLRGSFPAITRGLLLGLFIGACWCGLAMLVGGEADQERAGPLTRMAGTPGLPQQIWFAAALLLAPPVEELLFRGVLYGGYRKSFGAAWAALLTTGIFVALHVTEFFGTPAAALGIAAMALTALSCRLRSGAIGPAIAVHFGYNAVVGFVTLLATH